MLNKQFQKWHLALKVLPVVILVIILKLLAHQFGLEFISLNPLFTGIVTANIFLLGFLIAGVLADYKESEKLPGDLATSIETIMDECLIIYKNKKAEPAKECLEHTLKLTNYALQHYYIDELGLKPHDKFPYYWDETDVKWIYNGIWKK